MEKTLIVMCGPTASGKSDCAIELSKLINGEVISCDSMQLYTGMDIGTATPTIEEMQGITHHLISIAEPDERFSAAKYRELALGVIEDIQSRERVPILCGGTGLYIDSLTRPMSFSEQGDDELRQSLVAIASDEAGKLQLHSQLLRIDPESAMRLSPNDVRRVVRALEVYQLTGRTLTEQKKIDSEKSGDFRGKLFALRWPRDVLYERINRRVDRMIAQGLINEVIALMKSGAPKDATALQAIGYKELVPVLEGQVSLMSAIGLIKQNTRHYAKRQLTWFQRDERVIWIDAEKKTMRATVKEIAKHIKEDK